MRYFFEDYALDTDRCELRRGADVVPTTKLHLNAEREAVAWLRRSIRRGCREEIAGAPRERPRDTRSGMTRGG